MFRSILGVLAATAGLVAVAASQTPTRAAHTQLVIVVDGLRPDDLKLALMPRLVQLGRRGSVCNAHPSVLPTVTRVNASSIATGTYPESHACSPTRSRSPR